MANSISVSFKMLGLVLIYLCFVYATGCSTPMVQTTPTPVDMAPELDKPAPIDAEGYTIIQPRKKN